MQWVDLDTLVSKENCHFVQQQQANTNKQDSNLTCYPLISSIYFIWSVVPILNVNVVSVIKT